MPKFHYVNGKAPISINIISIILAFILLFVSPNAYYLSFLLIFSSVITLFTQKETLSKVYFDKTKVSIKWLGQENLVMNWSDMLQITKLPKNKKSFYIAFITKKDEIKISPTKEVYATILATCPRQDLIDMLNSIEEFKQYH